MGANRCGRPSYLREKLAQHTQLNKPHDLGSPLRAFRLAALKRGRATPPLECILPRALSLPAVPPAAAASAASRVAVAACSASKDGTGCEQGRMLLAQMQHVSKNRARQPLEAF